MSDAESSRADREQRPRRYDLGIAATALVSPDDEGLSRAAVPSAWERLWARMGVEDRRAAALEYLRESERHPLAAAAAVQFLAAELKTRVKTVASWSLERRAAKLAIVRGLPSEHIAGFVTIFHRRRRGPMLARFLTVAGIPHEDGLVSPNGGEAAPAERLALAVRAIEGEFAADHVALYLDALEVQRARPFRNITAARALAEARREQPPSARPAAEAS